jgi:hypothetical protein
MRINCLVLLLALTSVGAAEPKLDVELRGEVVMIFRDGREQALDVGWPCADLWVSPDKTVIAFVAVKKLGPRLSGLPQDTAIYVAFQKDGFKPVPIGVTSVMLAHRQWRVFRRPRVMPNVGSVVFAVPYTATADKLFAVKIPHGRAVPIGDASEYCAISKGKFTGQLITQVRTSDVTNGVSYSCRLRSLIGKEAVLNRHCEDFDDFVSTWTALNGECS